MTIPTNGRGLPGLTYPEAFLGRLAVELGEKYAGTFSAETVQRYVLDSYTALLRTSKVKAHLAIQTKHFVGERLTALAQVAGVAPHDLPEVLYICEQNAGRSQMAAAITAHLSNGRVHVRSAGSLPAHQLNPDVVTALAEAGIPLEDAYPKPLTDDVVQAADVVVTMGCGDACPIYPGKRYEDWQLADPAELDLDGVRGVRDSIIEHVTSLLGEIAVAPAV
ncbi:arsenate reductase ArsC [Microbacterium sp. R86528]|uniref:arsenate reductase/protein-tyrosine-phosphatase family protein n=1 Tax=Microbacterium sp. R86528 TaxID=3093864 RepID=UPI0037CC476F